MNKLELAQLIGLVLGLGIVAVMLKWIIDTLRRAAGWRKRRDYL